MNAVPMVWKVRFLFKNEKENAFRFSNRFIQCRHKPVYVPENFKRQHWPEHTYLLAMAIRIINRHREIIIEYKYENWNQTCYRINPNDTLVLLGDYDVTQTDDSQSRAFDVERLISNDDYDPATHENDIALLVLNMTTVYNNFIQPACLPVPGPRYANQTAVITGTSSEGHKSIGGQNCCL